MNENPLEPSDYYPKYVFKEEEIGVFRLWVYNSVTDVRASIRTFTNCFSAAQYFGLGVYHIQYKCFQPKQE